MITSAYDAIDEASVTDKLTDDFHGLCGFNTWGTGGTSVLRVDPTTNVAKPLQDIGNAVSGAILTNLASLNNIYTIKYGVSDSAGNAANSSLRYFLVRDTLPPVIGLPPTQLVIVDATSTLEPGCPNEQSVKDYLVIRYDGPRCKQQFRRKPDMECNDNQAKRSKHPWWHRF